MLNLLLNHLKDNIGCDEVEVVSSNAGQDLRVTVFWVKNDDFAHSKLYAANDISHDETATFLQYIEEAKEVKRLHDK